MNLLSLEGTEALLHCVGEDLIGWRDLYEENFDFHPVGIFKVN
jgi:hypothetical protein